MNQELVTAKSRLSPTQVTVLDSAKKRAGMSAGQLYAVCIILGFLGLHRARIGQRWLAVFMFFTFGGAGLLWLYDVLTFSRKAAQVQDTWELAFIRSQGW